MSLDLSAPLDRLPGVDLSAKQRQALQTLACTSLGNLLLHLPRRYEDRQHFEAFPNQPLDRAVCLCGIVTDAGKRYAGKRSFFEITLENSDPGPFDGPLVCRWFQMPWIHRSVAVDQYLVVYGKPKISGKRLVIDHPDFEIVDEPRSEASVHLGRITPIYPLTPGINQRQMRELLYHWCQQLEEGALEEIVPSGHTKFPRWEALRRVHFPETMDQLALVQRDLALEEFLQLQLTVLARRRDYRSKQGASHCGEGALLDQFLENLPFEATAAQTRSIAEIRKDLAEPFPMNRLLQGDVGSGKTLVAVSVMLLAVEAGFQAALMAPTQILAEQHYLVIQQWLEPLGIRVSLRTADRQEDGFLPLMAGSAEPQILVGTHALLYDKVETSNLGFVVIDEQHKFGVLQRGRLMDRAHLPDVLVMTATPIPRTLTMTLYGDLDVSILDELPKGRGRLVTAVRAADKTPEAAKFLAEQLEKGRQAYIVYPLIEESEKLKLASATEAHAEWQDRLGKEVSCGLLHGRLASEEKENRHDAFSSG